MTPPDRLFAYGTLMFPGIFAAVCGVSRVGRPATLADFACLRVRGHVFPGIMPRAGATTTGCIIDDVDGALWRHLDEFESDFYERITTTAVDQSGAKVDVQTYVVRQANRHILEEDAWSADEFETRHLASYLARF